MKQTGQNLHGHEFCTALSVLQSQMFLHKISVI